MKALGVLCIISALGIFVYLCAGIGWRDLIGIAKAVAVSFVVCALFVGGVILISE
jgi:hypothetical protein